MKIIKSKFFIAVVGMMLFLSGCSEEKSNGGSSDLEVIKLRAATGLNAQHVNWSGAMEPWMKRVEELTDGQVEFETFTGGELVSTPGEADAVLNGTVDVAVLHPIYEPDQYPMAEVTMLPLNHSDTLIAAKAWRGLLESEEELADGKSYTEMQFADFKIFPISTTQEYSISTTGKEFNTESDIKGTSLRTPSRIHEMYAQKTGINSVTMPAVEMYDALSRGTFEGAFFSIADWSGYGFQDLFKYTITGINFGHYAPLIGMNKEKWNELPENVQKAMNQANEEVFVANAEVWMTRAEDAMAENKEKGGKFVNLSSLDQGVQDIFNAGIEDTWMDYIELLESNGLPGKKLVIMWRDLLIKEGGEVPEGVMSLE